MTSPKDIEEHFARTGGFAFPSMVELAGGGTFETAGMSMRDWFAGMVLPYVAEFHGTDLYRTTGPSDIATKAYDIADAMLAERVKAGA